MCIIFLSSVFFFKQRTADEMGISDWSSDGCTSDLALAAEAGPEDYAEILDDAGLKVQARAPMTPIVKLIFGAGHDKARLTEYAAALSHARREDVKAGGFMRFPAKHQKSVG